MESKIASIQAFKEPSNISELRSFLGMVTYLSDFIPHLATLLDPLRELTRKNVTFSWTPEKQKSFEKIKQVLSSNLQLAHFSTDNPTSVIVDASPVGLGAILMQTDKNGVRNPIAYASRSLTNTERKYCQTEKEALSVVWACEKFHIYLYGSEFNLYTDHKALETIYSPTGKPSARIQRWSLRLQPYRMHVKFIPGKPNPADYLSRSTIPPEQDIPYSKLSDEAESFIRFITVNSIPKHIQVQTLLDEARNDPDTIIFRDCLQNKTWGNTQLTRKYKSSQNHFTYKEPLILMNNRILIPTTLRQKVLNLGHQGHLGNVKMKALLRTKVWWPNINNDIENFIKSCASCTATSLPDKPLQIHPTATPNKPWEVLHIDLCGPFPDGSMILALIDEYSRWPEVHVFQRDPTTSQITGHLRKIFAVHGIPYKII